MGARRRPGTSASSSIPIRYVGFAMVLVLGVAWFSFGRSVEPCAAPRGEPPVRIQADAPPANSLTNIVIHDDTNDNVFGENGDGHDHDGHVHSELTHPDFENSPPPLHDNPNRTFAVTVGMTDLPRFCMLAPVRGDTPCSPGTAKDTPIIKFFLSSLKNMVKDDRDVIYEVWFGHDAGDVWYGDPACAQELHDEVDKYITPNIAFHHYVIDNPVAGSPCFAWNELAVVAYKDGCDYFHQTNDDTSFLSASPGKHIIEHFEEPSRLGFGQVAPLDKNNGGLATQAVVSRLHLDIFGFFYPAAFKNWYSDNYMANVYANYSFTDKGVLIRNENGKRKKAPGAGRIERYKVDFAASKIWKREVDESRGVIRKWLAEHNDTAVSKAVYFPATNMLPPEELVDELVTINATDATANATTDGVPEGVVAPEAVAQDGKNPIVIHNPEDDDLVPAVAANAPQDAAANAPAVNPDAADAPLAAAAADPAPAAIDAPLEGEPVANVAADVAVITPGNAAEPVANAPAAVDAAAANAPVDPADGVVANTPLQGEPVADIPADVADAEPVANTPVAAEHVDSAPLEPAADVAAIAPAANAPLEPVVDANAIPTSDPVDAAGDAQVNAEPSVVVTPAANAPLEQAAVEVAANTPLAADPVDAAAGAQVNAEPSVVVTPAANAPLEPAAEEVAANTPLAADPTDVPADSQPNAEPVIVAPLEPVDDVAANEPVGQEVAVNTVQQEGVQLTRGPPNGAVSMQQNAAPVAAPVNSLPAGGGDDVAVQGEGVNGVNVVEGVTPVAVGGDVGVDERVPVVEEPVAYEDDAGVVHTSDSESEGDSEVVVGSIRIVEEGEGAFPSERKGVQKGVEAVGHGKLVNGGFGFS